MLRLLTSSTKHLYLPISTLQTIAFGCSDSFTFTCKQVGSYQAFSAPLTSPDDSDRPLPVSPLKPL